MKILIAGNSKPWSIERYFVRYLEKLGAEIAFYGSGDIVYDFHTRNLLNKVLFRSRLITMYSKVNKGLLNEARKVKPDVIWVFKGMEIYPETLRQLRKEGFKLANYNPDHPFVFVGRGSGNKNVTDSVGLFDLHFSYQRQLQRHIEKEYRIPTVFLPFGYEAEDVEYIDSSNLSEVNKLCFQANPDGYRVKIIRELARAGVEVDVYGHGWSKTDLASESKVQIFPIGSRTDFWRMNQEYRVQLNLLRKQNFGSHNMRTFEIPVVGGIQLTQYSEEQAEFFEENEEIFFFRSESEIAGKVAEILKMEKRAAGQVRMQARKRSLQSGYSFADRAATVFGSFKSLI